MNSVPNLELGEDTPFSGRFIALMESVAEGSNRIATRVSASTEYISETPKLWKSRSDFEAPNVLLKMRKDYSSEGNPGNWLPVYQRSSAIPAGTKFAWRGSPVGTISAAWYRCDVQQPDLVENVSNSTALPSGCEWISGATSTSYTPVDEDLVHFIGMQLTAENTVGTSIVRTASSRSVTDDVKNVVPPTLEGGRTSGETISVQDGTWTGTPAPTLSRKWFHCPTSRDQGASVSGCTEIAGQTSSTLTLTPAMAGRFIVAQVTGQNF